MALSEYTCYYRNQKVNRINIGGNEIRYVYKDGELIWEKQYYTPGELIYESNSPNTLSIDIKNPGIYQIIFVGGAGGSASAGSGGGGTYIAGEVPAIEGS